MPELSHYEKTGYLHDDFKIFHLKDTSMRPIDFHYHDFHKILIFRKIDTDTTGGFLHCLCLGCTTDSGYGNGTLFLFSFLKQRGIIFIFAIP